LKLKVHGRDTGIGIPKVVGQMSHDLGQYK